MDQTPDRQSHYYLQLERRFRFLEEWRKARREVAKGGALRLRESPVRRARLGMLVGSAGGVPTRMIDARVVEIGPGQTTSTHRHVHDAVVFVIQGKGLSTIDGGRVEWNAWDAWHTPAWTWHRHTNSDRERPARLLAVTDAPLVEALGLQRIQDAGTSEPPVQVGAAGSGDAPVSGGESLYEQELARDREARKERAAARRLTRFQDVTFRVSPRGTRTSLLVDGSLGFRTSGLSMAMFQIPPGQAQARHRHPGEAILYVVEGRGYSLIDEQRYEWESGDALLVNRYCWHHHVNSDPDRQAVLIRMHMWESMIEIMQAAMDPVPLYEDDPALRPLGTVTPPSGG